MITYPDNTPTPLAYVHFVVSEESSRIGGHGFIH